MFKQSENDAEISDFLTDIEIRLDDYSVDRVSSIYYKNDYLLLLFFSKDGDKGFNLYTVENFKENVQDLILLNEYFKQLLTVVPGNAMFIEAEKQVQQHIFMVSAAQMMMGKK